MKSQATRNPAQGPSERAAYVYMPPAEGKSFASCPIAVAAQMQAIRASPTDSGRACCGKGTEMKIEYATAAAGAMCVMDWNRTCGSPIECSRRWSKRLGAAGVEASIDTSWVAGGVGESSRTSNPSRNRGPATLSAPGDVPEWPKGTGCKPVGSAYGGSNPPAPISLEDSNRFPAVCGDSVGSLLPSQDNARTGSIASASSSDLTYTSVVAGF